MAAKKLKLWFDKKLAQELADKILLIKVDFDKAAFVKKVNKGLAPLELKDRIALFADELEAHLADTYPNNIALFLQILGPENKEETGMFTNFYWIMPLAKYVEKYGLDHFSISLKAIKAITKRNTGEYTIRPFLERYPRKTLKTMQQWSKDKNSHVRRLACEGLRPRLPWAAKIQPFIDDPSPILPILEQLKDDPSKYVQKSVANCLNDVLKDNFPIGQKLINQWKTKASKERKWIIKHALRNFLKKENAWAMKVQKELLTS